ncbi:hypothetical protein [Phytohabitans houttuyneae]|uniref:Uncharacterized protein n=1 Tax=Phytohabitans houttuyneae TaxID=1076126 RepID=A0A6V8KBX5_9ACTN|nr:hypothetical protein [Phytohabitans houttuyneae]GFJ79486.1 hypothetical protein Phou_036660 [Phytohabitans houttuyneae]
MPGAPRAAYYGTKPVLGDATQAVAVADAPAMTSAAPISGGESPTEAEFNALRADVVALRTTVNALLASLRTSTLLDT